MYDILTFQAGLYFAFGQQKKSSLIAEFCRENKYQHIKNPILEAVQNRSVNSTIIEGSTKLFWELEPLRQQMQVIFVGSSFSEEEVKIRREYRKIGRCIEVKELSYEKFRKAMFPNLIFFYGPIYEQCLNCAHALANQIGYVEVSLPPNANSFIKEFKKTVNYVVCGLFTQKSQLQILQQFFNIKVIHLHYNRIDLPQSSQYFDKEFELLSFLKGRQYYFSVSGLNDDIRIIDQVSELLSPALVYCQVDEPAKRQYLDEYVERNQQTTLILSVFEIQSINKRKNIALAETSYHRTNLLNEILYKDFNIKRALILDYPFRINEILNFESNNRKFQAFVDLVNPNNVQFIEEFVTPMYFLQNQFRIVPNLNQPLESYLSPSINYWLVNGPAGSGKTTVAKFLAAEYGFKLIQYEPYFATVKEKLITPEDGDELPLRKILAHFKTLLTSNPNDTYLIDGLPFDNKDLEQWIKEIGTPSIINLEVQQNQSIKRTRKKNQADVNAEITEQDLTKARESQAKSQSWLEKVRNQCSSVQVHELNFNSPLILSQKLIHKIFKKNVFLVQRHNSLTFQNVALKYNLALINLHMTPLKDTLKIIRKIPNKDLVLCYYHQEDEKLVSEDLYWIEKNIGYIRYLGINQSEPTETNQQKIELERPQVAQKPKVQGAEGQEKPPEQQPAEKKDIFDIYAYEWTKPSNPKNLSQWFLKSKKNVTKTNSADFHSVFNNWKSIVEPISQSDDNAIYHTFQ